MDEQLELTPWLEMATAIGDRANGKYLKLEAARIRRLVLLEERKAAARAILRGNPQFSDRAIGEVLVRCAPKVVTEIRAELEEAGDIPAVDLRVRSDGKLRTLVKADLPVVVESQHPEQAAIVIFQGERGPPHTRPEVLLLNDDHYKKASTKSHRSALNYISRRLWGVDCDDDRAHWEKLNSYAAGELVKKALTSGDLERPQDHYNTFLLLAEKMRRMRHIDSDVLEDLRGIKFSQAEQPKEYEELPTVDEIARIATQMDLETVNGWQELFWLAMTYPVGLRISTIAVMKRSYLETLDQGWLMLWRPKGKGKWNPAFINPFEGVKAIIRKWESLIPEEAIDCLSFAKNLGGGRVIDWDHVVGDATSVGNAFRSARARAQVGSHVRSHRARTIVETRSLGIVDKAIVNSHLSHRQDQIDKAYIDQRDSEYLGRFKDVFADVPEMMAIDAMLLNLVKKHLSDEEVAEVREYEARYCWNCGDSIDDLKESAEVCRESRCRKAKSRGVRTGPKRE